MRLLVSAGRRLLVLLMVAVFLTGCGSPEPKTTSGALPPATSAALAVPAALIDEGIDLRAGPVAVPLELQLPSISVSAPVVGVGVTPKNVMEAPMGPAGDPVWEQAFWYRGSAVPGAASTALIAGHVGGHGRESVFAHIDRLQPGDPIVVHDTRNGLDVRFSVTESKTYSLDQAAEPAVLTQIYGVGPVAGTVPQPSADGLSHLTLITCSGEFVNGTHDHRLVVYATRTA
jgi:sortase (surface protein transpeptidase)